ncbi:MAG: sodium-dependent transporter, partial [Bacteroidales bacterium]|nr:sodium-dependent transporter [Bacteroidales bacterium]
GSPLHIGGSTVFDLLDHMTASYFMPIGGLLIVLFVGWTMKRADAMDELTNGGTLRAGIRKAIYCIIRYLAPVAIAVIFISQLVG